MRILGSPLFLATCVLSANGPLLAWYVARMGDGSDEPWGVLALGIGFVLAFFRRSRIALTSLRLWGSAVCVLGAGLVGQRYSFLPQGVLVAGSLAFLLADRRSWVGHSGLFLLGLPLISSLQFYAGFPMRWMIGQVSSLVLSMFGFSVEALGTTLLWRGERIVIDAPCSGVQMLWCSAFFACLLICAYGLDTRRSIRFLQATGVIAFGANVGRNIALFFVESGVVAFPEWAHEAIGAGAFGLALALIGALGSWLSRGSVPVEIEGPAIRPNVPRAWVALVASLALLLGSRLIAIQPERAVTQGELAGVWTGREELLRDGWAPLELDDASARFALGFPGTIELFGRGEQRLVARVMRRATRRYHMARDCFRAMGYAVEPMALLEEADGTLWGRTRATRAAESFEIRERVVSQDGRVWTDASSWFWSAFAGQTQGPWIAYTETLPL